MIKWNVIMVQNGKKSCVSTTKNGISCPAANRICRLLIKFAKSINSDIRYFCTPATSVPWSSHL
jgi:hypothetical protein